MIKKVTQKHKNGCGAACFAMLAGLSYNDSVKILYPQKKLWGKLPPIHPTKLFPFFEEHEVFFSPKNAPINIWRIQYPAILVIKPLTAKQIVSHAVVWDPIKKRILDPYKGANYIFKDYQDGLTHVIRFGESKIR